MKPPAWIRILVLLLLPLHVASGESTLPVLFDRYCLRCHGDGKVEGHFDLRSFQALTHEQWQAAHYVVDAEEMPIKGPEPDGQEREAILRWIEARLAETEPNEPQERQHLARLTRDQYNNTMRDLLGVDLRPGARLAMDGEGRSGFRNDRASLAFTQSEMEKVFVAAEQALLGLEALQNGAQTSARWEVEEMRVSTSQMRLHREGRLFVGESQLASATLEVPVDGYYEVKFHAATHGKPVIAQILLGTEVIGHVPVTNPVPETEPASTLVFLQAGQPELSFNSRNLVPQAKLPRDANYVFNQRAQGNALQVPELGEDATETMRNAREALINKCVALQQAFEWLRALGTDGDSRDIDRFRRYARERIEGTEKVRKWYGAEVLGLDPEAWDSQWQEFNAERLRDNQWLLDRVEHVQWGDWLQYQGKLYVDAIDIRGPVVPEGQVPRVDLREDPQIVLEGFLPRAFRRSLVPGELHRYASVFHESVERGASRDEALRLAIVAALTSPHFLLHDGTSLASKLSYFLWQSAPDEALLELERRGELEKREVLREQVRRLIQDRRFEQSMANFIGDWLGTGNLGVSLTPDPYVFPEYKADVLASAKEEPVRLWLHLIRNNSPVSELLRADYVIINHTLAQFYGVDWNDGGAWQFLSGKERNRGGLLGMSAILAATSTPVRTSPSTRGAWVWERLFGREIGDPLPDAGVLTATVGEANGLTLREEMELHRSDARCVRCHQLIDPIGLGLENYNGIGQWRDEMAGKSIDASGELREFGRFDNPVELKELLAGEDEAFTQQVASRLIAYALGREMARSDEPAIEQLLAATVGLAGD